MIKVSFACLCSGLLCLAIVLVAMPTVINATTSQDPASAEPAALGRSGFDRSLIDSAVAAQRRGEISRRQLFSIRLALRSPAMRRQIQQSVARELWLDGKLPSNFTADGRFNYAAVDWGSIDWEQLLNFIIQLIEAINQIFGSANVAGGTDGLTKDPGDLSKEAGAAVLFSESVKHRLAQNFQSSLNNWRQGMTRPELDPILRDAMDSAWSVSRDEFTNFMSAKFKRTPDEGIGDVLEQYAIGFRN